MMIAEAKITEIFCVIDEFNQNFEKEMSNHALISSSGKRRRNRKGVLSESEIMTILVLFHFSHCRDLKHFYLHEICIHLRHDFPQVVSYNRFVEVQSHVFFHFMFFLKMYALGHCTG
ncbi:MAG: IS982 family transposase, partial [Bacteroidaceae bacterium]|nr:IS982 family transposase [Bacteroidaceae bacterium]